MDPNDPLQQLAEANRQRVNVHRRQGQVFYPPQPPRPRSAFGAGFGGFFGVVAGMIVLALVVLVVIPLACGVTILGTGALLSPLTSPPRSPYPNTPPPPAETLATVRSIRARSRHEGHTVTVEMENQSANRIGVFTIGVSYGSGQPNVVERTIAGLDGIESKTVTFEVDSTPEELASQGKKISVRLVGQ